MVVGDVAVGKTTLVYRFSFSFFFFFSHFFSFLFFLD